MADVNWHQYHCNICLAVGLSAAAVASALITAALSAAGIGIVLLVVLFLVIWGVLFKLVDGFCASRGAEISANAFAGSDAAEAPADAKPDAANAETSNGSEAAAKEADAAAEKARVEQAAAEQAAAERAAEEKRAAEAAAAAATAAQEKESADAAVTAEREAEAARAQAAGEADYDGDGIVEGSFEGTRPEALDGPRDGVADDLKRIKGIGPKMETLCNSLGFYHFDQIANWTPEEVAWVDANLEGFKGRVTRDAWVSQAQLLASGGETDFSKRVDEGDVPSSQ